MGFVKRKGTKSVKQLPTDFDEIKKKYVEKVSNVVTKFQIPDSLIINWDQTVRRHPKGTDRLRGLEEGSRGEIRKGYNTAVKTPGLEVNDNLIKIQ